MAQWKSIRSKYNSVVPFRRREQYQSHELNDNDYDEISSVLVAFAFAFALQQTIAPSSEIHFPNTTFDTCFFEKGKLQELADNAIPSRPVPSSRPSLVRLDVVLSEIIALLD